MSVRQFANLAGVQVVPCGPGWGGRWAYKTADAPNCMFCGYRTKTEARLAWMEEAFGGDAMRAIHTLLENSP